MSKTRVLSKEANQQRDKALDVSISINESILRAIDSIRGDTNRSLWLRRLAVKELQRLREKEREWEFIQNEIEK
jgi:hypothetical protein